MNLEGVSYTPFLLRFTTLNGRRHVKTLWMPAQRNTVVQAVVQYLDERGDVDAGRPVIVRVKR